MTKEQKEFNQPPTWADKFLEWYCSPDLIDEIQGDLHEAFHQNIEIEGLTRAKLTFIKDVILFFRPSSFKANTNSNIKLEKHSKIYPTMFSYYLKIAIRNFRKYKVFSSINVIGLTLGLAFTLIIALWVLDELKHNRTIPNVENIYQVMANLYWSGDTPSTSYNTPGPLEEVLESQFPEIEHVAKTQEMEELFTANEETFKEMGMYVSPDFLEIFQFPVIKSTNPRPKIEKGSIIITKEMARRLFGDTDVVGENVQLNQKENLTITAVLEDIPTQSTIKFNWLMPFEVYAKDRGWVKTWGNFSFSTYIQLDANTDRKRLEEKFMAIKQIKDHNATLFLHPYKNLYLYSKFENGKIAGGRIEYLRLFSTIAFLVLLLACINFVNLSTARATQRAREIGVRKVVGARKTSLFNLFMIESFFITFLAIVLAILLSHFLLPTFNLVFGKELVINYLDPYFCLGVLTLTIVTSFLAGSYPALFLASFQPVKVLKGELFSGKTRRVWLRKSLVIFQFVLSFVLISGVLVINRQIQYIKNKNLGIDRNDIFEVDIDAFETGDYRKSLATFRQELLASSAIKSVTATGGNPMNITGASGDFSWPGKDANAKVVISPINVGNDFIKTMGIKLLKGRDFRTFPADSANYIINESAAKLMGMEDPIGQEASFWLGKGQIIGLIEDYHLKSLHEAITPQILVYEPANTWLALIKATDGKTAEAIAHTEKVFKSIDPSYPFAYKFLDESFERQYQSETVTGKLANWFAIVAIFISCLGLFGLVMYTTERRTKEIGIRKVLGASVSHIFGILSTSFLKLVLIAIFIALPIAWFIVRNWLNNFAYHIDLQVGLFVLAAGLAIGFAFLTVCFQSVKAALANPVESLRDE